MFASLSSAVTGLLALSSGAGTGTGSLPTKPNLPLAPYPSSSTSTAQRSFVSPTILRGAQPQRSRLSAVRMMSPQQPEREEADDDEDDEDAEVDAIIEEAAQRFA